MSGVGEGEVACALGHWAVAHTSLQIVEEYQGDGPVPFVLTTVFGEGQRNKITMGLTVPNHAGDLAAQRSPTLYLEHVQGWTLTSL